MERVSWQYCCTAESAVAAAAGNLCSLGLHDDSDFDTCSCYDCCSSLTSPTDSLRSRYLTHCLYLNHQHTGNVIDCTIRIHSFVTYFVIVAVVTRMGLDLRL